MNILSDTPPIGFLDINKDHRFFCGPMYVEDSILSLDYNMRFAKVGEDQEVIVEENEELE